MKATNEQRGPATKIVSGSLSLQRQPSVHYGAKIAPTLARIMQERRARRVLPVVTGSLRENLVVVEALKALGDAASAPFHRLKPHTPFEVVLDLTAEIRRVQPDMIVAVGGGSAIDAVKIAALAAPSAASDVAGLRDLRARPDSEGVLTPSPSSRTIPVVAVPTTLSAAEFGMIGGATDVGTGIKHIFKSENLAPDIVVFDPSLGLATPDELWLSTGIRALDHGIETVVSRDANPYTDALALRGIALLQQGLRASHARRADPLARHNCQLGVWLVACAIGRVRYGASHGLGHQLGGLARVPHGIASCVLLPAVLAYNLPVSREAQAAVAAALGRPGGSAAEAVRDLIASIGLPTRIAETGVSRDLLPRIAETSLGNAFVRANVRPIASVSDAMKVLESAF